MSSTKYKVVKGTTKESAILDSTGLSLSKARDRAKTLRDSLRGRPKGKSNRTEVWILPMEPEDPKKYRKIKKAGYS